MLRAPGADFGRPCVIRMQVFVRDGEWRLALKDQAVVGEFPAEACLVDRFQQARTELPAHLDCEADDLIGQFVHTRGIGDGRGWIVNRGWCGRKGFNAESAKGREDREGFFRRCATGRSSQKILLGDLRAPSRPLR